MKVSDNERLRWFAKFGVASALGLIAMSCAGQSMTITGVWARATVAGQKTAGAYAELMSASRAALVGAESPAAASIEFHTMSVEGGVMRMRRVERIDLPAQKVVKLAPGGLHLMLVGIRQQLKAGDKLPLVLTIESQGGRKTVHKVEAEVRAVSAAASPHH